MSEKNYLSFDSSILYRCNQKYFDKCLLEYDLGYTHMLLLTEIYENEGVSMNELALRGVFDKGTITKSIQKLEQLSYVTIQTSEADKRSKMLYTTSKAQQIMPKLYNLRSEWNSYLSGELSEEELETYNKLQAKLIEKAREYSKVEIENDDLKFYGLQKLTLLDYPGHMAATVFTGGCNFRCPFCHNKDLVFLNENDTQIAVEDIYEYLEKRKNVLDGLCVSGGEPLLHKGIKNFIKKVKGMGFKVKLDTNGSNFEMLKELIDEKLVDYVAMDIKNSKQKYQQTVGLDNFDIQQIEKSKNYLLENHVDYEFRTTVVKQFHNLEDFKEIGGWIKGAKHYFLQNFEDHGSCIEENLSCVELKDLYAIQDILKDFALDVQIRGIKE